MMTRRDIMIRAHQIAKALKGDYIACLSEGLRIAWEIDKRTEFQPTDWVEFGESDKAAGKYIYKNNKFVVVINCVGFMLQEEVYSFTTKEEMISFLKEKYDVEL